MWPPFSGWPPYSLSFYNFVQKNNFFYPMSSNFTQLIDCGCFNRRSHIQNKKNINMAAIFKMAAK